jgi:hypothetical protein
LPKQTFFDQKETHFASKRQKDKWLKMSSDSNQFHGNSDSDEGSDDGEAIEVSL